MPGGEGERERKKERKRGRTGRLLTVSTPGLAPSRAGGAHAPRLSAGRPVRGEAAAGARATSDPTARAGRPPYPSRAGPQCPLGARGASRRGRRVLPWRLCPVVPRRERGCTRRRGRSLPLPSAHAPAAPAALGARRRRGPGPQDSGFTWEEGVVGSFLSQCLFHLICCLRRSPPRPWLCPG